MIIDLTGVREDGTPRGPNVPANPRRRLKIVHGEEVLLRLLALNSAGVPVNTTGLTFTWAIRKKVDGAFRSIKRDGTANPQAGPGRVDFVLAPADTLKMLPGQYAYDVWITSIAGVKEPLVPFSDFSVEPALFPIIAAAPSPSPPPAPPPPANVGFIQSQVGAFTVLGSVSINDVVYVTGAFTAALADNGALATSDAVGIVIGKPTATTATIVFIGQVDGLSGLTPAAVQFLGLAGATTETAPTTVGDVLLRLGVALSTTSMLLDPRNRIVL